MKKARVLALAIALAVSVMLFLPYLVQGLEWTSVETFALFAIGMIALAVLLLTNPAQQNPGGKARSAEGVEMKTISILACHGCEFSEQREFEKGDFIGKVLGKCPKCPKRDLYIRAIYNAEEKKDGKR